MGPSSRGWRSCVGISELKWIWSSFLEMYTREKKLLPLTGHSIYRQITIWYHVKFSPVSLLGTPEKPSGWQWGLPQPWSENTAPRWDQIWLGLFCWLSGYRWHPLDQPRAPGMLLNTLVFPCMWKKEEKEPCSRHRNTLILSNNWKFLCQEGNNSQ